jgi:glycosyltransferase involved in cell wall biosynthesis
MDMDRPLITFSLGCYNQEAFIREAVAGAFSQTYSPLEILISDDCSQDRTFDIVREMAAAYKGPHSIRLNRNARNLGIGGNSNRAMEMFRGELAVLAAGDDISLPERTEVVVRAWEDSGRRAMALSSRFLVIDQSGRPGSDAAEAGIPSAEIRFAHEEGTIAGFLRRRKPHVAGCANALSRRVFTLFGPFPDGITYEDTALCFRTVLARGKFTFIDAPLVKYRRHSQNITFGLHQVRPGDKAALEDFRRKRICELERFVPVYRGFAVDAERAMQEGLISKEAYPAVRKRIQSEGRRLELKRDLLTQGWLRRCAIFWQLYRNTIRPREFMEQLPHLLPRGIYDNSVVALNRLRREY